MTVSKICLSVSEGHYLPGIERNRLLKPKGTSFESHFAWILNHHYYIIYR